MTLTCNWTVAKLYTYPTYEGHTNVVFAAHWRCDGADGGHNAGLFGAVDLTLDPEATFASYADLTEAQVIGWVKDALGAEQVAKHEANVAKQIAALANPPVVTPPLPWA
jgi:hypothetical protein